MKKQFTTPFLLFIFLSIIHINCWANEGNIVITGTVFTADNEPARYSTITLLNEDSVLIGGTLSQEDGNFILEKIAPGTYFVQVRNLGFNTFTTEKLRLHENEILTLEKITLLPSVTELDETVITAQKAMVEIHPDKMVVNVSSSVNAAGNNGLELIGKSPGVMVDMDNNIIIQGKSGVQVYVNGRPTRLSGSDLTTYLESLRSENIETLEIITNPSSKYEAEGSAGIINIVTKKNANTGFNGNATGSYLKGIYPRSSIGTSLNYSGNKINFFSNVTLSDDNWLNNNFNEKTLQSGYLLNKKSKGENNRKALNFATGFDYSINEKQSLSIDGRVVLNHKTNDLKSTTAIFDTTDLVNGEILRAKATEETPSENYIVNANYQVNFSKTSNLSTDFSYGKYINRSNTLQPNAYYNSVTDSLLRESNREFNSSTDIDLWSIQVDYEKKFKTSTLSAGGKYAEITTGNQLAFYNLENGIPVYDITKSNTFNYVEKIAAIYALWNVSPFEKLTINAGLRMENTFSLGTLISDIPTENDRVKRNYLDFFPNLGITFDDKKNHVFSISYGRRITRPNYQSLNPFETRLSELSAWRGNPFLKPKYIDNYQLSYSFKQKLVITNTFSITHDFFATIFEIDQDKGNVLIPRNLDKATNNGLSVSYPFRVFKWWDVSSYFMYNYETYKGDIEGTIIDLHANIYALRLQNNLKLPGKIIMEFTGTYDSPWIWRGSVKVEGTYSLNVGVKREFWDRKLLVQLTGNDILRTESDFHYKSNYGGMIVDGMITFDNRRFGITATYKFGNQKLKTRKKGKSGIDDELKRISD